MHEHREMGAVSVEDGGEESVEFSAASQDSGEILTVAEKKLAEIYRLLAAPGGEVYRTILAREKGNQVRADSIAHALLDKAVSMNGSLATVDNVRVWLHTAARNKGIDHMRTIGLAATGRGVELTDKIGISVDDERVWDDRVFVEQVFDRMEPEDVQVLRLKYVEGMKQEEIAAFLQAPLGTIKSRIIRASAEFKRLAKVKYTSKQ